MYERRLLLHACDSVVKELREKYGKENIGGDDFEEVTPIQNVLFIKRGIQEWGALPAPAPPLDAGNCTTCRHGRDCKTMDETKCGNKYEDLLPQPAPAFREAVCERQCADCPFPDRLCCECINSTFAKAKNYSGAISVAFWRRINAHGDKNLYAKACKLQELENEIHAAIREEG